jgi:hypothetical protein
VRGAKLIQRKRFIYVFKTGPFIECECLFNKSILNYPLLNV